MTKRIVLPLATLAASLLLPVQAQTPANWLAPVDGSWSDAAKWSTAVYPGYDTHAYHAQITAIGDHTVQFGLPTLLLSQLTVGNGGKLHIGGSASFEVGTISGTGTIQLDNVLRVGTSIGPGIVIEGSGALQTALQIGGPGTFTNHGLVRATNPAKLLGVGGYWNNTGTLEAAAGTLTLSGTFSTAGMGTLRSSGGIIVLSGRLNNASSTLTLNNSLGDLYMDTGWITGGRVEALDGRRIIVPQAKLGILDSVTLASPISVLPSTNSATIEVLNGLTMDNAEISLLNAYGTFARLRANGTQTIGGTGTISLDGTYARLSASNEGEKLTVGHGITVRMAGGRIGENRTGLELQGRLIVESSPFDAEVRAADFRTSGTVEIQTGAELIIPVQPGFNTGTIILNGGTLSLFRDVREVDIGMLQRNGGTVNIAGTLQNQGTTTYLDAFGGDWTLGSRYFTGAVINGGTIAAASGKSTLQIVDGGSLVGGVYLNCDAAVHWGRQLYVSDALDLHGRLVMKDGGTVVFDNGAVIRGSGTITFGDVVSQPRSSVQLFCWGMVNFGENVLLHTGAWNAMLTSGTFVNSGTIAASTPGSVFAANSPSSLLNQGFLQADTNGQLDISGNWSNSGTIVISQGASAYLRGGWFNTGHVTVDGLIVSDYTSNTPLATIQAQLATGYAGGTWTGPGINSEIAAADPQKITVLALPSAMLFQSFPETFRGLTVDNTSIVLLPAILGDANLDDRVNTLDFNILAGNFGGSNPTWLKGDFDQDGDVDSIDFTKLLGSYGMIMPSAASLGAAVPEPSSCGIFLLASATLFRGRRR